MNPKNEGITIPARAAKVGAISLVGFFLVSVVHTYLRTSSVEVVVWPVLVAVLVACVLTIIGLRRRRKERVGAGQHP